MLRKQFNRDVVFFLDFLLTNVHITSLIFVDQVRIYCSEKLYAVIKRKFGDIRVEKFNDTERVLPDETHSYTSSIVSPLVYRRTGQRHSFSTSHNSFPNTVHTQRPRLSRCHCRLWPFTYRNSGQSSEISKFKRSKDYVLTFGSKPFRVFLLKKKKIQDVEVWFLSI